MNDKIAFKRGEHNERDVYGIFNSCFCCSCGEYNDGIPHIVCDVIKE